MAKRIIVVCPICNKSKWMPIPRRIFDVEEGSLLKLPISSGNVCEHYFIAEIDFNFSIRGYDTPNERNNNLSNYFNTKGQILEAANFSFF